MGGGNNRRKLARTCKKYGLLVQPNALPLLLHEMEGRGETRFLDLLGVFKEKLAQRAQGPKLVTLPLVQLVLQEEEETQQQQFQKAAAAANNNNKRKKNKIVLRDEIESEPNENQNRYSGGVGNAQQQQQQQQQLDLFRSSQQQQQQPSRTKHSRRKEAPMPTTIARRNNSKPWRVVSAFEMPKLVYDSMGRQFHYEQHSQKSLSLMGTSKDLMDMRIHRYQLVKQKVDRHREQKRLAPLTTIDRLLGATTNGVGERTLLGMLRSNPSLGCLELEDPTGSLPLRIDRSSSEALFSKQEEATTVDTNGLYLEGSMVLVRGYQEESELLSMQTMDDSSGTVFRCTSIELPPLEHTTETKSHLPPSPYANEFRNGFRNKPGLKTPVPIYSLSNLSLDEEECIERVGDVVDRMVYETSGDAAGVGAVLVLFGNFCTESLTTFNALEELARLLHEKEIPSKHSVLLVPGPNDVGSNACWPLPAWAKKQIPSSLHSLLASSSEQHEKDASTSRIRNNNKEKGNVHLCTNPCRLEFSDGRQVLLMRKNLIQESLQHQVLGGNASGLPPLVSRVFYHTLSQCHLSPSSSSQQAAATSCSPIYWNYDHAMALYPLPDLMILGLDAEYLEDGTHFGRAGCRIVAPVSNPSRNEWQCSVTTLGRKDKIYVEFNNADDDDEEEEEEEDTMEEQDTMETADDEHETVAIEASQQQQQQTDEEIYEKYRVLAGTQDTQFSQTQELSAY